MASLLDAPIPGQSLTDSPGNWPWENPPEMSDPEEATKYYVNKLANEDVMDDLSVLLSNDMPLVPLVKTLLTTGVMNGIHSIDVSIIIAPVIHAFIKASMTNYNIEVRDDITNPEDEIKEGEKKRLQMAIELAVAKADKDGVEQGDEGVALLDSLQQALSESSTEAPVDDTEKDISMEVSAPAEPMGLMAKGA